MRPAGIEPATFRFVAQHLNHCATAVPVQIIKLLIMLSFLHSPVTSSLLGQEAWGNGGMEESNNSSQ